MKLSDEEEALSDEFERGEIPPERFTEVMLSDPILLLLAEHKNLRICRSEFFCAAQDCHLHEPITSLWRLATHIQTFHGAAKEETADTIGHFITRSPPNPIQAVIATRDRHRGTSRRCFSICHCPGCSYRV
jgi:hypothetical protein